MHAAANARFLATEEKESVINENTSKPKVEALHCSSRFGGKASLIILMATLSYDYQKAVRDSYMSQHSKPFACKPTSLPEGKLRNTRDKPTISQTRSQQIQHVNGKSYYHDQFQIRPGIRRMTPGRPKRMALLSKSSCRR